MSDTEIVAAPLTHVIVMTTRPGYWGKGKSIEEAIKNAKWLSTGEKVRVIEVDAEAYIDSVSGGLFFNNRKVLGVGLVRADRKGVRNLKPETVN